MTSRSRLIDQIFSIATAGQFAQTAVEVFRYQYARCAVYRQWVDLLGIDPRRVAQPADIPFLPIEVFKTQRVVSFDVPAVGYFQSSGTTGMERSHHYYHTLDLYDRSLAAGFEAFWGKPSAYRIVGLLPHYLQQGHSSLIHMMSRLMELSGDSLSGFHEGITPSLVELLRAKPDGGRKLMLFGVTYALLDLMEQADVDLSDAVVFETGGMKGRRTEMVKAQLHQVLCEGLHLSEVASEYGMCELFSQAYSRGAGLFHTPAWMQVFIRDVHAPQRLLPAGCAGGINVVDLANLDSCAFVATQDLGRRLATTCPTDTPFEILGRIDHSDIRGCNLMADAWA